MRFFGAVGLAKSFGYQAPAFEDTIYGDPYDRRTRNSDAIVFIVFFGEMSQGAQVNCRAQYSVDGNEWLDVPEASFVFDVDSSNTPQILEFRLGNLGPKFRFAAERVNANTEILSCVTVGFDWRWSYGFIKSVI